MNPNIKNLAKLPRGTAWHSRLAVRDQEIRRRREVGETYRQIAAALSESGTPCSPSAVHSYVRVRALCERPMYALPNQVLHHQIADEKSDEDRITCPNNAPVLAEKAANRTIKKYIFQPEKPSQISLSEEDLAFNDPLKLN